MTIRLGFSLVSGPDNIHEFQEASSDNFKAGDLVQLDANGYVAEFTTATGTSTVESAILGVAAADANNDTANAYLPVYVITPEQTWKVHAQKAIKPSTAATFDIGEGVKAMYSYSASYTLSNGTTTTTTAVGAWVAKATAATATKGMVIVGYDPRAGSVKGGNMLVRFTPAACQGIQG